MAKISLNSYLIKVVDNRTKELLSFNNIVDDSNNVLTLANILNEYFMSRMNKYYDNENNQKILSVSQNSLTIVKKGNSIRYYMIGGIIKTGSYGYSSEIYNKETGAIEFRKPPSSAEMLPFFYGVYLPYNSQKGVCIFQKFMQFGIKSCFEDDLKSYIQTKYPFIRIELNPLLPEDYLKSFFTDGRVLKLRFIKYEVPKDIADRLGCDGGVESLPGRAEYTVVAKRRKSLPVNNKLLSFVNGSSDMKNMFEITNFSYDNIKVELKINGVVKTINMSNFENLNGSYEVTEDLEYGIDGHPIYGSVSEVSKGYAENFLTNLGLL